MRILEYSYRLMAYLQQDGVVPKDTGNLQERGFSVQPDGMYSVKTVIGGVEAPYAPLLEQGFTHYITGRPVTKHKGWATRGARTFAEQLAKEIGGVVTYD